MFCKDCTNVIRWSKSEGSGYEYDCNLWDFADVSWNDPNCPRFVSHPTNLWMKVPGPDMEEIPQPDMDFRCSVIPERETYSISLPIWAAVLVGLCLIGIVVWPFFYLARRSND